MKHGLDPLTICLVNSAGTSYIRNRVFKFGLELNGVRVLDCGSELPSYAARIPQSITRFIMQRGYDAVIAGFLGQPLVPFITALNNKPLVFDMFISIYDTLCFDRKRFNPESLAGIFSYFVDRMASLHSSVTLLDTNTHIEYISSLLKLPKNRFRRVFVGADTRVFSPVRTRRSSTFFDVFYYSTFLPLHGVEEVIGAARHLRHEKNIRFFIAGNGPLHPRISQAVKQSRLDNVRLLGWLRKNDLARLMNRSHLCLGGHFTRRGKGARVIAGKTYQMLACARPTIVGKNAASKELLKHEESAYFVEMDSEEALAQAILDLRENPPLLSQIALNGHSAFAREASPKVIGKQLRQILSEQGI